MIANYQNLIYPNSREFLLVSTLEQQIVEKEDEMRALSLKKKYVINMIKKGFSIEEIEQFINQEEKKDG